MKKKNLTVDLTFDFALDIIKYCEELENNIKCVISNQLLKSGTSIGENVREAQSAECKRDFIHKLKIADKEAVETEYWLLLCKQSNGYPSPKELIKKMISIKKVLSKIISTSKSK